MTQVAYCTESCGPDSGQPDFYDFLESRLMFMSHLAHKSVLFEKIKKRIEQEEGDKLDKIAELLVQASKEKWESDIESDKKQDELRNRLRETFEG